MDQIRLWEPSDGIIENSNLKRFEKWISIELDHDFDTYAELWNWTIGNVDQFWNAIFKFFDVLHSGSANHVTMGKQMPNIEWFEGVHLSYSEHLMRHKNSQNDALIFANESSEQSISWKELEAQIFAVQNYLKSIGIKKGDVVAAYLPNIPQAISSFIAVNSIGAVWTCCSPDFGETTVIERFLQCSPKCLICCDGYSYGGKKYARQNAVRSIIESVDSINNTLMVSYLGDDLTINMVDRFEDILRIYPFENDAISFERVPFGHPIWILYSSGTTGKPKAITHSHGGVLLEHLKYMSLHNDVKPGECFFWYSTTGWMMWNFLQSSMLVGAIPVLYDGSPAHPDMNRLWQLADDIGIHHFGTSAPFLTACMKNDLPISSSFGLNKLRSIGSTGSPLPAEVFEWVYQSVKNDVWLCSMSGGTDVCTAFVGGCIYEPVYKGYIQSRSLGAALFAYDDEGKRITNSLGEMIIEKPMPSMPIYFWNDQNKKRYLSSYFEEYPDKWRHGDWINILDNGSLTIHGRSDATLNRNGIRIGTAEIYSVLDNISEISDSLILNLERSTGDIMPLFVVLKTQELLGQELKNKIISILRKRCSPRHVPSQIIAVPDIPYTLSGKKMEVPIKKLLMGMSDSASVNLDSIKNPNAMKYFIEKIDFFKSM